MRFNHIIRVLGSAATIAWLYLLVSGTMTANTAVLTGSLPLGCFWAWQLFHGMHYRPWLTTLTALAVGFSSIMGIYLYHLYGFEGNGPLALMLLVLVPGFTAIVAWPFVKIARIKDHGIRNERRYYKTLPQPH
jgi:hypothetical protein